MSGGGAGEGDREKDRGGGGEYDSYSFPLIVTPLQ